METDDSPFRRMDTIHSQMFQFWYSVAFMPALGLDDSRSMATAFARLVRALEDNTGPSTATEEEEMTDATWRIKNTMHVCVDRAEALLDNHYRRLERERERSPYREPSIYAERRPMAARTSFGGRLRQISTTVTNMLDQIQTAQTWLHLKERQDVHRATARYSSINAGRDDFQSLSSDWPKDAQAAPPSSYTNFSVRNDRDSAEVPNLGNTVTLRDMPECYFVSAFGSAAMSTDHIFDIVRHLARLDDFAYSNPVQPQDLMTLVCAVAGWALGSRSLYIAPFCLENFTYDQLLSMLIQSGPLLDRLSFAPGVAESLPPLTNSSREDFSMRAQSKPPLFRVLALAMAKANGNRSVALASVDTRFQTNFWQNSSTRPVPDRSVPSQHVLPKLSFVRGGNLPGIVQSRINPACHSRYGETGPQREPRVFTPTSKCDGRNSIRSTSRKLREADENWPFQMGTGPTDCPAAGGRCDNYLHRLQARMGTRKTSDDVTLHGAAFEYKQPSNRVSVLEGGNCDCDETAAGRHEKSVCQEKSQSKLKVENAKMKSNMNRGSDDDLDWDALSDHGATIATGSTGFRTAHLNSDSSSDFVTDSSSSADRSVAGSDASHDSLGGFASSDRDSEASYDEYWRQLESRQTRQKSERRKDSFDTHSDTEAESTTGTRASSGTDFDSSSDVSYPRKSPREQVAARDAYARWLHHGLERTKLETISIEIERRAAKQSTSKNRDFEFSEAEGESDNRRKFKPRHRESFCFVN
ncbi:MAG: hypothetical protein SEPTF4163_003154 [Sporothrix epigloea]